MKIEGSEISIPSHYDGPHWESRSKSVKDKIFSGMSVSESNKAVNHLSEMEILNNYHEVNLPYRSKEWRVSIVSNDSGYISNAEENDDESLYENKGLKPGNNGIFILKRIESFEEKASQKKRTELKYCPIPESDYEVSVTELVDNFEKHDFPPEADKEKYNPEDKIKVPDNNKDINLDKNRSAELEDDFNEPGRSPFDRNRLIRKVIRKKKNHKIDLPSTTSGKTKLSHELCPEPINAEKKIQHQLVQIFSFRAALSDRATRFHEVEPYQNGALDPGFVMRAITDIQSFVRLCEPYNLIRDVNMDLEQVPDVMKLVLGEDRFKTLRGEALRDAVWPAVAENFWKFLDECGALESTAKLMPEFQKCEQYFPLAFTRAVAKFNLAFGIAEKKFQKYYLKSSLTQKEKGEVLQLVKMADQLQNKFSDFYYHFKQLPNSPVKLVLKTMLGDVLVDDSATKSKKIVRMHKGI